MWFSILKVDEFTREGGFRGLYDPQSDKVLVNLDKFKTVAETYNDMDRVVEFANVVTHELSHREYAYELQKKMQEILDELQKLVEKYSISKTDVLFMKIREKLEIYLNYAIINEAFAYSSAKTYNGLKPAGSTQASIRSVFMQVSEAIRDTIGDKDRQIERMLFQVYTEAMDASRKIQEEV